MQDDKLVLILFILKVVDDNAEWRGSAHVDEVLKLGGSVVLCPGKHLIIQIVCTKFNSTCIV